MKPNTEFVPFAIPSIGPEEEAAVISVLRSGWLTTGKVALAFEEDFKAKTGSQHALAVNSATSGLHLALEALGIGPGDKVAMSPYTFTASAETVRYVGADIAFVDTGRNDSNIDPDALERTLDADPSIKAVMPVHIGGLPCDMDRILDSCVRHGCKVVEDSAHAFPVRTGKRFVGTLGDIGVYSFYATKTITTGEGGMVVTDNDALAKRMRVMRLHGIDRDIWNRYTSKGASWEYQVVEPGFKYNMPDLLAAVGVEQLKKADRFLAEREVIAKRYDEAFDGIPGLALPPRPKARMGTGHAWHLYQICIDERIFPMGRDGVIDKMKELSVGTSVHFIPLHVMPYWSARYRLSPESFPNAYARFRSSVSLPIFHGMSHTQVESVIRAVLEIAHRG